MIRYSLVSAVGSFEDETAEGWASFQRLPGRVVHCYGGTNA
jgi:hypothetical protein